MDAWIILVVVIQGMWNAYGSTHSLCTLITCGFLCANYTSIKMEGEKETKYSLLKEEKKSVIIKEI
jgi:hypothetical protein